MQNYCLLLSSAHELKFSLILLAPLRLTHCVHGFVRDLILSKRAKRGKNIERCVIIERCWHCGSEDPLRKAMVTVDLPQYEIMKEFFILTKDVDNTLILTKDVDNTPEDIYLEIRDEVGAFAKNNRTYYNPFVLEQYRTIETYANEIGTHAGMTRAHWHSNVV